MHWRGMMASLQVFAANTANTPALRRTLCRIPLPTCFLIWVCGVAVPSPALAFRTAEDVAQFAGAGAIAWQQSVVEFAVTGSPPSNLAGEDLVKAVEDASQTWLSASCNAPVLQIGALSSFAAVSGDLRNTIEWVHAGWVSRGFPPDAPGATDIVYEKKNGVWAIVEADIYLNAELFEWSTSAAFAVHLESVVTHELGHALGLLHPCEMVASADAPACEDVMGATQSTMYPVYDPEQVTLAADDIAGLCYLYPKLMCEEAGCPAGFTCIAGACEAECNGGGCVAGDGALGDPCFEHRGCASGMCVDGRCVEICATSSSCPSGECVSSAEGVAFCKSQLGGLGEFCEAPDECIGAYCIQSGNAQPLCSRECGSGCPNGWDCTSVQGKSVCWLNRHAEPSGGCACVVAGSRRYSERTAMLGIIMALGALGVRRRRVRSGT